VAVSPQDCFAYVRKTAEESLLMVLNFSSEARNVSFQDYGKSSIVLSTYLDRSGGVDLHNLDLRMDEGVIVKLSI
jgi:hypothetical protein